MSIYAIADLHLSTKTADKSMEVFGKRWDGYMDRIERNWRHLVKENDTVIIPGDISWALSLEDAADDLLLIDSLPGKKLISRGNHDYWWASLKKMKDFFCEKGITKIEPIQNNAIKAEGKIICASRGWFYDKGTAPQDIDYKKIVDREVIRIKLGIDEARKLGDEEILMFLHFPPALGDEACPEIIDLLNKEGIKRVFYGHIHGKYDIPKTEERYGMKMTIVSADYLNFIPLLVR